METKVLHSAVFVVSCLLVDVYASIDPVCGKKEGWQSLTVAESDTTTSPVMVDLDTDDIVDSQLVSLQEELISSAK